MNEQNNQQNDSQEARQTAASELTSDHSTDKLTDLPVATEQAKRVAGGMREINSRARLMDLAILYKLEGFLNKLEEERK